MAVTCRGWCSRGRRAEDGKIPQRYPVQEIPEAGYLKRTVKNLLDSDGTLLIAFGNLGDGTVRIPGLCRKYQKLLMVLDGMEYPPPQAGKVAAEFVRRHGIVRLYVTGPRASREPRGYQYTYEAVTVMLRALEYYVDP
jgi:hypothetical protein